MSKAYDIIFSPYAEEDLESIYDYIMQIDETIADRIYNTILDSIEKQFSEFPERCKTVKWEPGFSIGIRQKDIDDYSVLYLVDKEKLIVYHVLGVLYEASDIEYKMNNRIIELL